MPSLAALPMLLLLPSPALARDDGTCGAWLAADELGQVDSELLVEVSGVASSHRQAGVLWLHNDHGSDASLHATGLSGDDQGRHELLGADNEDWEDLALGPCSHGLEPCSCLHLADMGDNDLQRDGGVIFRVEEPTVTGSATLSQTSALDEIWFAYPDGSHDAEALLVHPDTGEVLVLTKEQPTQVFAFPTVPPQPAPASQPSTLELVASFDLGDVDAEESEVTGGAVSPRGYRVVLRTDEDLLLFTGAPGDSLESILRRDPVLLPTPPPGRGEAVTFSADGRRLYLVGEGAQPGIYAVDCASFTSDGEDPWDPLADCEEGCGGCSAPGDRRGQASLLLLAPLLLWGRRRRGVQPRRRAW